MKRIPRTIERDDLLALVGRAGYEQAALTLGVAASTVHKWVGEVDGHAEMAAAAQARRLAVSTSKGEPEPLATVKDHGTEAGYSRGCRAKCCREASTRARARRRRRVTG